MTAEDKSDDRSFHVQGNVDGSAVVLGDGNIVTYTTNVFSSFEVEQFPARPSQRISQQEYRWRQVLVQNVKHYWIEGVLERSLHNQALIELGLEERAQAVASPIGGVEEFATETERSLPTGTQATDIFDSLGAGRTLLILGEPGAGKTTTLLKLAKTLITRIGDDFSQPIPIVLNLSSWANKRQSIAEWLVQDLYEIFQVSKSLGTGWIKEEQLTLCLDGLDEVAAEHRNACLQALNHFLQNHGRTEVVVCSRVRDYEALSERLRVRCAIYVQPLTTQQIDRYLAQAGEPLSVLSTAFNHNPEIRAFAASPLILSVMSLAYQGCPLGEFPLLHDTKTFRHQLLETYVERMFLRRGAAHKYSQNQTMCWLIWMAQQMDQKSQTVFLIERIQLSWLQTRRQRLWYRLESALTFGIFSGLLIWVSTRLLIQPFDIQVSQSQSDLSVGLSYGPIVYGLIVGISLGIATGFSGDIKTVETLKWSWKESRSAFYSGLIFGFITLLIFGLVTGLIFGLTLGLRVGGLGASLSTAFVALLRTGFVALLSSGLTFGLVSGLIFGLIGGLKGPAAKKRIKSNQGIRQSAQNALIVATSVGLIVWLISGLIVRFISKPDSNLPDELLAGLLNGLVAGLLMGLASGLLAGGAACLRHLALRLRLYRMGYIPWNYTHFLEHAAERLFLQKVGGGYIFIHRMLLEHFAQMALEQKRLK
ncbi:MAG: NACHT domain-containing protein [Phormidesmis sp.]